MLTIKGIYKASESTIKWNDVGCNISKMAERKPWLCSSTQTQLSAIIHEQFVGEKYRNAFKDSCTTDEHETTLSETDMDRFGTFSYQ